MAGGEQRVQVELERSGGFAGLTLRSRVDTAELEQPEAAEIRSLVAAADVPSLAEAAASRSPGPAGSGDRGADQFQYDLTVTVGDQRHHLRYGDRSLPAQLSPLVDQLVARAKKR